MTGVAYLKDLVDAHGGLERSPSLAEDAAQTLRGIILLEMLEPGSELPVSDLSKALGISRTPLREAIRLLADEGLIQYTVARRPIVANPSLEEIFNCLRIQGALEALAGELACSQASSQEIKDIKKISATLEDENNYDTRVDAFQADMSFHEAIVKAANNPQLAETHSKYNARLWRVRFLSSQRVDRRESTKQEHKEIVDALVSRDAKRVSGALRQHLRTAEKNISKAIKSKIKTGG